MRFNQLPQELISSFLKRVNSNENLNLSDDKLFSIQKLFKSDVRSMINYMQSNNNIMNNNYVIEPQIWNDLTFILRQSKLTNEAYSFFDKISKYYGMDILVLIKEYVNYIIRNETTLVIKSTLDVIEFVIHTTEYNSDHICKYLILRLHEIFHKIDKD
jgi:replication factor C subunit 3/5